MIEMKEISLSDLNKYSPWPNRLRGIEEFAIREKTDAEVRREFEAEKWNELLQECKNSDKLTVDIVEGLFSDLSLEMPYYEDGKFYIDTYGNILKRHLDLYSNTLAPHIDGASALVELGAGFGSKILHLSNREAFKDLPLVAGEYAGTGRDIMKLLNESSDRKMKIGHCDFRSLEIDEGLVPENAIIFTSYAANYVPQLDNAFADYLLALNPEVIVHFEPVYEVLELNTEFDKMCQKYMELNDYNKNLLQVIKESEAQGKSKISSLRPNCLSANPFLPISVLEWHPQREG